MLIPTKKQIDDALIKFHQELQDEPWFLDIQPSSDSGGPHLEVIVNGYNYPKEDPLSRVWNNIPFVVIKRNIKIKGEKLI